MMMVSEGCESTIAFFGGPICDMVDGFGDQENLPKLSNDNAQAEYYITDLVEMAINQGLVLKPL